MMLKVKNASAIIAVTVIAGGCAISAAMISTSHGAMPVTRYVPPTHDVPPQVVYRLDNHRYVTLENYSSCTGDGIDYYNDTAKGIRTRVQYGALTYLGKLHIDSNEGFLAFPDASGPSPYTCGDRGCYMSINYSMDSGKTFERMSGWRLTSPRIEAYKATEKIIVAIKNNHLDIADDDQLLKWILNKNESPDTSPYEYLPSAKKALPQVRAPSGDEKYTCDDTLRPKLKK